MVLEQKFSLGLSYITDIIKRCRENVERYMGYFKYTWDISNIHNNFSLGVVLKQNFSLGFNYITGSINTALKVMKHTCTSDIYKKTGLFIMVMLCCIVYFQIFCTRIVFC